jgi:hypothetical protein
MGRVHAGSGSGYSGGRGEIAGLRGEIGSGVGIRCLDLDASAPVPIEVLRPAGTGGKAPIRSTADRTRARVGVAQIGTFGAFARIEVLLPVGWPAGRGDRGWRCGLTEAFEDALKGTDYASSSGTTTGISRVDWAARCPRRAPFRRSTAARSRASERAALSALMCIICRMA